AERRRPDPVLAERAVRRSDRRCAHYRECVRAAGHRLDGRAGISGLRHSVGVRHHAGNRSPHSRHEPASRRDVYGPRSESRPEMTSISDGELQPQPPAAGDGGIAATPDGAIRRRRSAKLIVGLGILCIYVIMAVLAPVVAPYTPLAQQIPDALAHPSLHHLLGTDQLGRDVLSRIIYGARVDLVAATAASVGACMVGTLIGLLTGYAGGWLDVALTRVMDMVQTIPSFTLLLVLLLVLGPGARSLVIALIVTH